MSVRVTPCGWTPEAPCPAGPCCVGGEDFDPDIAATANTVATNLIWALTGRRFGCCEVTVRPCKPETCKPLSLTDIIYWDQRRFDGAAGNLGVMSYFPTLLDGAVFNIACGCNQGCCTCRSDCEVFLPGPVCAITEVIIDGVTVPEDQYKLFDHHKLVFIKDSEGNTSCPGCQNYNLPLGEVGTWSVTYTIGEPVPTEANLAAGLYACEIGRLLSNDKGCALPQRVQNLSRQGVDIAFVDPFLLADAGLTGIPLVDTIIRTLNPFKQASRSRIWSPDLPVIRREH